MNPKGNAEMGRFLVGFGAALVLGVALYWLLPRGATPREIPEPAAASMPVASAAPEPGSAAKPTPLGEQRAEFARLTEEALAGLPTFEQVRALPPAAVEHTTPKLLLDAAVAVGKVSEAVAKNPALAPEALAFYGQCARRAEVATSTRASCLADLRDLSRKQGVPPDEAKVDPAVVKLADRLKD